MIMGLPLVSICCETYNHEKYLRDAIEGFLMQDTDFRYEIIIHDDASTDKTADIIKSYAADYDNIIPVLQTENQHSKGVKILSAFVYPVVRGKYIAFCEGDDYWTDPKKLQKQIDYMEKHPDCTLCVHASTDVTETGEFIKKRCRYDSDRIITAEEIIFQGGGFFSFASIVYPSRLSLIRPSYFAKSPVGDVPISIFLATQGYAYYFHDDMSCYRTGVPGSWTSRIGDGPLEVRLGIQESMADFYKSFDELSEYKYHRAAMFMLKKCQIHAFRIKRELRMPGTGIFVSIRREFEYVLSKISVYTHRWLCSLISQS